MGSYGKDFLTFWAIKSLIFELGSKFLDLPPHFRPQGWLYKKIDIKNSILNPPEGFCEIWRFSPFENDINLFQG